MRVFFYSEQNLTKLGPLGHPRQLVSEVGSHYCMWDCIIAFGYRKKKM